MTLTTKDRDEIVACKGIFKSPELARIFDVHEGQIRRIWFNAQHGIEVRPGLKPSDRWRERMGRESSKVSLECEEIPPEPIVDTGKVLLDLEIADCRWIIGKDTDGEYRYCGCERGKDQHKQVAMYCREHALKAFIDPLMIDKPPVEIEERVAAQMKWGENSADDFIYASNSLSHEAWRMEAGCYLSSRRLRDA